MSTATYRHGGYPSNDLRHLLLIHSPARLCLHYHVVDQARVADAVAMASRTGPSTSSLGLNVLGSTAAT